MRLLYQVVPPDRSGHLPRTVTGRPTWTWRHVRAGPGEAHILSVAERPGSQRRTELGRWTSGSDRSGWFARVHTATAPQPELLTLPSTMSAWNRAVTSSAPCGCVAVLVDDQTGEVAAFASRGAAPPLVWHASGGHLLIASFPSDLVSCGAVPVLDPYLFSRLVYATSSAVPGVPLLGIHTVRPGETVIWQSGGRRRLHLHERRAACSHDLSSASLADAVEVLHSVVDAEIEKLLTQGGPWAVMLSGGLDSALVAQRVGQIRQAQPLSLYTHAPAVPWAGHPEEGNRRDEVPVAAATANGIPGARHVVVSTPIARQELDNATRFTAQTGMPMLSLRACHWLCDLGVHARQDGFGGIFHATHGNSTTSLSRVETLQGQISAARLFRSVVKRAVFGRRWSDIRSILRFLRSRRLETPWNLASSAVPAVRHDFPLERDWWNNLRRRSLVAWIIEETDCTLHDPLASPAIEAVTATLPGTLLSDGDRDRLVGRALIRDHAPRAADGEQRQGQTNDYLARIRSERTCWLDRWRVRRADPSITTWFDADRAIQALATLPDRTPISLRDHPDAQLYSAGLWWNEGLACWLEWVLRHGSDRSGRQTSV